MKRRHQLARVFFTVPVLYDIPVFDDEPLPADAVAVTESTLALLSQADLFDLLRRHPDVGLDVMRLFASRLRAYKLVVEDLSLRDVVTRVARLLLDRARGQAILVEDSASVSLRYTQHEVAAMVGSVREVVQRALKTLEDAGVIQMARGRIRIIHVETLNVWIESGRAIAVSGALGAQRTNHPRRRGASAMPVVITAIGLRQPVDLDAERTIQLSPARLASGTAPSEEYDVRRTHRRRGRRWS